MVPVNPENQLVGAIQFARRGLSETHVIARVAAGNPTVVIRKHRNVIDFE